MKGGIERFSRLEDAEGKETGTPASEDYHGPFKFTGEIKKVVIEPGKSGLAASDDKELEDASKKLAGVRD